MNKKSFLIRTKLPKHSKENQVMKNVASFLNDTCFNKQQTCINLGEYDDISEMVSLN